MAQISSADIGRIYGVTRATVSNWKRRHPDFPPPVGGSDRNPVFDEAQVRAWTTAYLEKQPSVLRVKAHTRAPSTTSFAKPRKLPARADEEPQLSEADVAALLMRGDDGRTEFERRQCEHCGGVHSRACFRVKRKVERTTPDGGKVVEVEYFETWTQPNVIWPEMLGVINETGEVSG